jgi:hypothetical protein
VSEPLRHESLHDGFVAATGQRPEFADAIDRHIAEYFGPVEFVLHEMVSHLVGVHVYVVAPTEKRPFRTLITSGMSDLPMTVPAGHGISPYAELVICLPAGWPITGDWMNDDRHSWPIWLLKQVARLPHQYGTWVGEWHSMPNGDPAQPYDRSTPFAAVVVTPMLTTGPEARVIEVPGGERINLLALVPLHPDELAVKLEHGTDALIELLDRGRVHEVLDPARGSAVSSTGSSRG